MELLPKPISAKKVTAVNLAVNYSTTAFTIITSILFVPIYLRYFDLATYGAWLASGGIIGMLGMLDGGINLAMTQKLCKVEEHGDAEGFSEYFAAGSCITLALAALIPVACYFIAPFLGSIINYNQSNLSALQAALVFAGVSTFLAFVFANVCTAFQAWGIVHYSGLVSVGMLIVGALSTLVGLWCGLGILSIPLGGVARGAFGVVALLGLLAWQWNIRRLPLICSIAKIREMADISLAVSGGRIISGFAANSESLIVSNLIDPKAVAIWTITSRSISTAAGLINPIGSSMFAPLSRYLTSCSNNESWKTMREIFLHVAGVAAVFLGIAVALNSAFVSLWVGADKYAGHWIDILTASSVFITQRSAMMGLILTACGKPKADALFGTTGSVLQMALLFLLARHLGIIAIPLTRLVVAMFVVIPLYTMLLSQLFSQTYAESFGLCTKGFRLIFVSISFGLGFSILFSTLATGWVQLCFLGLISLMVFLALVGLLSTEIRSVWISQISRRLSAR